MSDVHYFWDPVSDTLLQERDATGVVSVSYMNEPGPNGALISQRRAGAEMCYHFNAQGSVIALSAADQQTTDTYSYTAFGQRSEHIGNTTNPFQYIGRLGYYRDDVTEEY